MTAIPVSRWTPAPAARRGATLLVIGLMLLFAAWFSAYSIRLHDAHLTHKADLGQIDQAIWNTSQGRFVQEVKDDRISTRLTDHVEPIFLLVAPVFWVWDNVRALLVLQAVALAAGAWPIYLFARKKLTAAVPGASAEWGAAAFAAAYLLMPALQAAAVAEFHAMPLAAPLIAAALWAGEERRWGWFALWAVLVMTAQEGAALLGALLGAYAAVNSYRDAYRNQVSPRSLVSIPALRTPGVLAGTGVFLAGLAWFAIATFVIIPRFAAEAYALGQTPYAARYGALGESFGDVLVALVTRPLVALRIALEPLRVNYLLELLIPTAGLALLSPGLLLAGAPLLLANLLSSFPLQYSGEAHYSAALAPYFVMAGAAGAARVLRSQKAGQGWAALMGARLPAFMFTVVAVCAVTLQVAEGFMPIGGEFRRSPSRGWPEVTAHHRLLTRFDAIIPADAAVSTTPSLHPHLAHRQRIYLFPIIGDADYVLVDMAGTADMHPGDLKDALAELTSSGEFAVADAADGYLLLQRGLTVAADADLPDPFFDFARAQWKTDANSAESWHPFKVAHARTTPQHPLDITFGGQVRLIGYDVVDNPKWRLTRMRFYWQALGPLPADLTLRYQALSPAGEVVDDAALRPMPALLWYPPERWRPGETVVTESLAWYLPRAWAGALSLSTGGGPLWPEIGPGSVGQDVEVAPDARLRLPPWMRLEGALVPLTDAPYRAEEAEVRFADDIWTVRLSEWAAPVAAAPGHTLPVALKWRAAGPAAQDYSVFLHLRDVTGRTVAQGDANPTWFVPRPASRWPTAGDAAGGLWTSHAIALPEELPNGRYDLVAGWYDWQTGVRLPLVGALGNRIGEEHVLGPVTIDADAGPRPDIACLLLPESCAALE